jgi:hypothetical protein
MVQPADEEADATTHHFVVQLIDSQIHLRVFHGEGIEIIGVVNGN